MVFSLDKFNEWCDKHNISRQSREYFLQREHLSDGVPYRYLLHLLDVERWCIHESEYHFISFLKKINHIA